jgi:hypothetical protein
VVDPTEARKHRFHYPHPQIGVRDSTNPLFSDQSGRTGEQADKRQSSAMSVSSIDPGIVIGTGPAPFRHDGIKGGQLVVEVGGAADQDVSN